MLVLGRKLTEKIVFMIGDIHIELMVTEIKSNQVKLGISAPPSVKILREELTNSTKELASRVDGVSAP